jgi:hypothetical protein
MSPVILGDNLLAYFGCRERVRIRPSGRCVVLELVEAIALLEAHLEVRLQAARIRGRCSAAPFSVHCAASNDRVRLSVKCRGRVPAVGSGKHRSEQGIEIPFYSGVGAS